MGSLVLELQQQAASSQSDLSELLRKSLIIASKLEIIPLKFWIERELNGYSWPSDDFPSYRMVSCRVEANHPYYGWQPVNFGSPELQEKLSEVPLIIPVGQIATLLQENKSIVNPFPPAQEEAMKNAMNVPVTPQRVIDSSEFKRVLDDIRLALLTWMLQLEKDGVLGDGINFSPEEKQITAQIVYQIQNFVGIAGSPQAETINIDSHIVLIEKLERSNIDHSELAEIKSILKDIKTSPPENKPPLAKRGMEWIARNWDKAGTLAVEITKLFS